MGDDFTAATRKVNVSSDDSFSGCFNLITIGDSILENDEVFSITISTTDENASIDKDKDTVIVTIVDQDSKH